MDGKTNITLDGIIHHDNKTSIMGNMTSFACDKTGSVNNKTNFIGNKKRTNNILFYTAPAKEWKEGLPISNGRLAAMVWGERETDILTLNHEWLWRGVNRDRKAYEGAKYLPIVRELLVKKEYFKATSIANTFLGGEGGISKIKDRVDAYQVAGELVFKLDDVKEYVSRELDTSIGIARASRIAGERNVVVVSEFLANCVSNLLMSSWTSGAGGRFSGELTYRRVKDEHASYSYDLTGNNLVFYCRFDKGIEYKVLVEVFTDGSIHMMEKGFRINGATYINTTTNIATSVKDIEEELTKYCIAPGEFAAARDKHSARFKSLMSRVELESAEPEAREDAINSSNTSIITTDKLIERMRAGKAGNMIFKLYFDYGRYLLVSSSVCGELPANLQGKWNDSINPPWNCDYHLNINLQMNYWMAEPANMPECAESLVRYVKSFMRSGREAARRLYGCRGVYLPLNSDAWGISTPEAFGWAVWIGAAAWMAQHLWWRYRYSGDKNYLKDTAYEYFKAVAEFYEDYLVEDENGVMQIMPSQSPENKFAGTGHFPVSIGVSAAMDVQLAYDAFRYAIQSAEILGVDEDKVMKWKMLQSKLPPFKIGSDGRLLEWDEEKEEPEPGHRHMSHLYGLYPSDLFTPGKRPAQFKAAVKSLEERLSHGGGHTGWSRAWVACMFARIGDGERFYEHYSALIRDFATVTLLDLHPPGIFQIDGNLGGVAAVIEAIVSYHDDKVHLLKALPREWENGRISGIKVPGGHTVNVEWRQGKVSRLSVQIGYEGKVIIVKEGEEITVTGEKGQVIELVNES